MTTKFYKQNRILMVLPTGVPYAESFRLVSPDRIEEHRKCGWVFAEELEKDDLVELLRFLWQDWDSLREEVLDLRSHFR